MRLDHFSSSSLLLLLLLEIWRCKFAEIAPEIYLLKLCNGIHSTKLKQERKKTRALRTNVIFCYGLVCQLLSWKRSGREGCIYISLTSGNMLWSNEYIHVKISCNLFCLTMWAVEVCNSRHCFEVEKCFRSCKAICLKQY